ncbi:hypothetical protein [Amycolatopsis sp. cmx-11-32]|uniref:hypothetical protein n=1 Tax=Amycolatopsis sp. cmx-11-32 TaxID=2785796 RepID=UPI0039E5285D
MLEEAGAANPTVSSVQSGGGERTISGYYVKDVRRCRRALRYYFAKSPTLRGIWPLIGLGDQAMTELDGSSSTTIIVQVKRVFLSVQYDEAGKGFFGVAGQSHRLPACGETFLPRPGIVFLDVTDIPPRTSALAWHVNSSQRPAVMAIRQAAEKVYPTGF